MRRAVSRVEDMLAGRGIDVSQETVRRWTLKFGALYAERAAVANAFNVQRRLVSRRTPKTLRAQASARLAGNRGGLRLPWKGALA